MSNTRPNEARAGIRRRGALALLAVSLLSAGCRSEPIERPAPTEIRIGVGVASASRGRALEGIGSLLFSESLLSRQTDGRSVPGLATEWRWEDEGRRLRLELKAGVRLHDGSVLTSEMVARLLRQSLGEQRPLGFTYIYPRSR